MNRVLKTFIVWLLLAVLPLNAVAAGRMSCGPLHPQSGQGHVDVVSQSHGPMADAHAGHGGDHASHADGSPVDTASAGAEAAKKPHATCAACSAFCLGALAPPSPYLAVPTFDGSEAVIVAPAAFAVGFIQDGPQRPPRHPST